MFISDKFVLKLCISTIQYRYVYKNAGYSKFLHLQNLLYFIYLIFIFFLSEADSFKFHNILHKFLEYVVILSASDLTLLKSFLPQSMLLFWCGLMEHFLNIWLDKRPGLLHKWCIKDKLQSFTFSPQSFILCPSVLKLNFSWLLLLIVKYFKANNHTLHLIFIKIFLMGRVWKLYLHNFFFLSVQ